MKESNTENININNEHKAKLLRSDYSYDLPKHLIANTPLEKRDESRLLVFNKNTETLEHNTFFNVINYMNKGDVLVLNETKVLPVRLIGKKNSEGHANCEVFLQKRLTGDKWEALVNPGKRLQIGAEILFGEKLKCKIIDKTEFGGRIVEFYYNGIFEEILDEVGLMPVPHYITKELKDKQRYNTVYAKVEGSSAAPTAGLHFTSELLEEIKQKGIIVCKIVLNVGIGTFRPVKEENILDHKMHSEEYMISEEVANIINSAKADGRKIIAVGTTSLRSLEASAAFNNGVVKAEKRATDIFIYGEYDFKVVDRLITNFHLPESTLIMLVSSFIGYDNCKRIYNEAIAKEYRFYSFGDSSLLIRN